jgi:hypothetical protein
MAQDRFFKEDKGVPDSFPLDNAFVSIDSGVWRKPYIISIERIGKEIQLKIDEETLKTRNVTAVKYSGQDLVPELSPESLPIDSRTHLSVDENYLYVWVPQVQKWKRLPLLDWLV